MGKWAISGELRTRQRKVGELSEHEIAHLPTNPPPNQKPCEARFLVDYLTNACILSTFMSMEINGLRFFQQV